MRCNACGCSTIVYDPNPEGREVIHVCLFGAPVTGELGACRCGACGSLDIDESVTLDERSEEVLAEEWGWYEPGGEE